MNQLEIRKIFIVAITLNLFLGLLSQVDFFWSKMLGFEGFFAGFASAGVFVIILVPLCALLSGTIVTFLSQTRRVANFFAGVFVSLFLSVFLVLIITSYNQAKSTNIINQMYAEDPQLRPIGDSLRPITIVSPEARPHDTKRGEVIDVIVYAINQPEYKAGLPIELVILSKSATNTMLNREVISLGKLNTTNETLSDGRTTFIGQVVVPTKLANYENVTDINLVVGENNTDILPLRLTDI